MMRGICLSGLNSLGVSTERPYVAWRCGDWRFLQTGRTYGAKGVRCRNFLQTGCSYGAKDKRNIENKIGFFTSKRQDSFVKICEDCFSPGGATCLQRVMNPMKPDLRFALRKLHLPVIGCHLALIRLWFGNMEGSV